jgi:hypothetical protein
MVSVVVVGVPLSGGTVAAAAAAASSACLINQTDSVSSVLWNGQFLFLVFRK